MWADYVEIISRSWRNNATARLCFNEGVGSVPVLTSALPGELPNDISTRVSMKVRDKALVTEFMAHPMHGCDLGVGSFTNAVWGLAPITDIDFEVIEDGERTLLPQSSLLDYDGYSLLRRLRFNYAVRGNGTAMTGQTWVVFAKEINDERGRLIGKGWPAEVGDGMGHLRSVITIAGLMAGYSARLCRVR